MKTFETEKGNIPEGATGYREQGVYIEWFSGEFGCWRLIASNAPSMDMCDTLKPVKPIPQTKEVEWVNGLPPVGVECEWIGGGLNHGDWGLVIVHACHNDFAWIEKLRDNSMHTVGNPAHFRKPETPQQREEREVNELCKSAINLIKKDKEVDSCNVNAYASFAIMTTVRAMIGAGYRVEGE
tara:strand:- start:14165 stop:14710 length:546 start_codon:yes stop_codon:yes gene_type:complete